MESMSSHTGSALRSKTRPFLLLLLIATAVLQKNADAYFASPLGRYSTRSRIATTKSRLNNSEEDGDDSSDGSSPLYAESSPMDATTATLETAAASPSFGDVVPLKRPTDPASARFGDVVSLQKPPSTASSNANTNTHTNNNTPSDAELLQQRKTRNIAVAVLSVVLAVSNYAWQWTHPVTPIQLLVNMERSSTPLTEIGKNNKPTVIDFWAPW